MNWIKRWWKRSTLNEKLMYALILAMLIGILTRWNYVWGEVGGAFSGLFPDKESVLVSSGTKPPTIDLPTPPAMLDEAEKLSWLALHFWDRADLQDTVWVGYPDTFAGALAEWGKLLQQVDDATTSKAVKGFMDKANQSPQVGQMAHEKVEWAFYDPNSPIRNFEAYISALEWILGSEKVSADDKLRPRAHLEMVLKNRKGTQANDFAYTTADGTTSSLYKTLTPYTLIYINNPGCPSCREYMKLLAASDVISNKVINNELTILGIYPDEDSAEWTKHAADFPKGWINGIDKGQKIKAARSYELNVIPSLILVDGDKRVLLKDAQPSQVEVFFTILNR